MAEDQNRTYQDKFMLRLPNGMRDRIKAAADRAGRSMNAEIVNTLERKYPPEIPLAEVVEDVSRFAAMVRRFKGPASLKTLADTLDTLALEISESSEVAPEDRMAAKKHASEHGKFTRYNPDDEEF